MSVAEVEIASSLVSCAFAETNGAVILHVITFILKKLIFRKCFVKRKEKFIENFLATIVRVYWITLPFSN